MYAKLQRVEFTGVWDLEVAEDIKVEVEVLRLNLRNWSWSWGWGCELEVMKLLKLRFWSWTSEIEVVELKLWGWSWIWWNWVEIADVEVLKLENENCMWMWRVNHHFSIFKILTSTFQEDKYFEFSNLHLLSLPPPSFPTFHFFTFPAHCWSSFFLKSLSSSPLAFVCWLT